MRDSSDAKRYRAVMVYEPETGAFTWRHTLRHVGRQGAPIGYLKSNGYLEAMYQGRRLLLHRVAWLYYTGHWPRGQIDHINGNKSDNRISNLRDVDHSINGQNRRRSAAHNKSGHLGVSQRTPFSKFEAEISVGGKNVRIGCFDTAEEAARAYLQAKRSLHDGCTI